VLGDVGSSWHLSQVSTGVSILSPCPRVDFVSYYVDLSCCGDLGSSWHLSQVSIGVSILSPCPRVDFVSYYVDLSCCGEPCIFFTLENRLGWVIEPVFGGR
jgi:hypothetical protein